MGLPLYHTSAGLSSASAVLAGIKKTPLAQTRGEIGLLQTMQMVYQRIFLLKFSLGKFWEGKRRRGRSAKPLAGKKITPSRN